MSAQFSKLHLYSLGIVAVNKPLSSKVIEVTPIEDVPLLNGELTDNVRDVSSKARDTEGAAYHTEVSAGNTIKATWFPLEGGGNRLTAPDVRRGERVIIYRYADTDQFWWVTQGQDMRLRKLETVIFGISATRDESAEPDPENMYWMEWSSHKKAITIHTSKADGEPYAYDIQINTAYGSILIKDDDGNSFSLDSPERIWKMINRDTSYIEINKREITAFAPDKITLKTKDLVFEVDQDHTTTVGRDQLSHVGRDQKITVDHKQTTHTPQILTEVDFETRLPVNEDHIKTRVRGEIRYTEDVRAQVQREDYLEGITLIGHQHREQGDGQLVSEPYPSTSEAWPWPTSP